MPIQTHPAGIMVGNRVGPLNSSKFLKNSRVLLSQPAANLEYSNTFLKEDSNPSKARNLLAACRLCTLRIPEASVETSQTPAVRRKECQGCGAFILTHTHLQLRIDQNVFTLEHTFYGL